MMKNTCILFVLMTIGSFCYSQKTTGDQFVKTNGVSFRLHGKPYYYIGANYWYGSLLGLVKDKKNGRDRLQRELDFLQSKGVHNVRVLAGGEGKGQINGMPRVTPALQPAHGNFDASVIESLDYLLYQLGKEK